MTVWVYGRLALVLPLFSMSCASPSLTRSLPGTTMGILGIFGAKDTHTFIFCINLCPSSHLDRERELNNFLWFSIYIRTLHSQFRTQYNSQFRTQYNRTHSYLFTDSLSGQILASCRREVLR